MDKKNKNKTPKPPRGRPVSTAAISRPAVEDTTQVTALSSFSPNGYLFAFLSLSVDKHRLRVYQAESGQPTAEYIIETARVTSLSWGDYDTTSNEQVVEQGGTTSPSRKKRKKKDSIAAVEAPQIDAVPVIVLGLSDGTIQLFSPNSGRVLRTVSSPTSTSPILSAVTAKRGFSTILWTSSGDTTIRIWNPTKNTILSSWKNGDRTPYTRLSPQPPSSDGDDSVKLLAANQAIKLLQTTAQPNEVDGSKKPIDLATFSGHTSNVLDLQWDLASSNEPRFLSIADADRFVYLWQLPSDISSRRDPIASIPLDSDARAIALSIPLSNYLPSSHQNQRLLTLTAAGRISIYPIPSEVISPSANTKGQPLKPSLPTLVPRSVLAASSKNTPSSARVVGATFASGEQGHVRVARVIGGIRPVFDSIVSIYSHDEVKSTYRDCAKP